MGHSEEPDTSTSRRIAIGLDRSGCIVVPLDGKRPLVKWSRLKDAKPDAQRTKSFWTQFPVADVGIVTGTHSPMICLDCDAPPYPDGVYTETPSGGRHYWYAKHPDDAHGLNVTPKHDVPWIVRVYGSPQLNPGRIPEQPKSTLPASPRNLEQWQPPDDPPSMHHLENCAFIQWFQRKRTTNWEGRYPLARAYASNVIRVTDADVSLGPDYQHEADIYERAYKPIGCAAIVRDGFECPNWHEWSGQCLLAPGISTPYGLAVRTRSEECRKSTSPNEATTEKPDPSRQA